MTREEAIAKIKEWDFLDNDEKEVLETLIPELKECEDEKVKRILHSILSKMSFHLHDIFTEEEFQCFDACSNVWLKKQGEQKPTLRERYENIAKSEWFKKTYEGMSVSNDEEPKWTKEDVIRLDRICKTLWKNRKGDTDEIYQQEQDVDWLKSLKKRVERNNND